MYRKTNPRVLSSTTPLSHSSLEIRKGISISCSIPNGLFASIDPLMAKSNSSQSVLQFSAVFGGDNGILLFFDRSKLYTDL